VTWQIHLTKSRNNSSLSAQLGHAWEDWLRLEQTPGVGGETARKLLTQFGVPDHIFGTEFSALRQVVSERIARALSQPASPEIAAQIDRTRAWLAQDGNFLLCLADTDYPPALLNIPDPPLLLYVKGRLDLLTAPALAIVGSRNATVQGVKNAEHFAESLSRAGLTVSSGLAAGIDAAAHQGGLRGAGSTIAVIGTGIDIVYPARNRGLAHQIADAGCIVSEYALGTPAIAANFPRRNRIISGIARGVLVVEAAAQSGSLITARMAAEQGRDVFAIPGSIHSPLSKGCHQLIKQGAKLVEEAQDILDELRFLGRTPISAGSEKSKVSLEPTDANASVLELIAYDPIYIESLVEKCHLDIATVSAKLFELELANLIESLPGGMVRRLG
jgi:DNA processing protein